MKNLSVLQKYKTICNDLASIFPESEALAMARLLIEHTTNFPIHRVLIDNELVITEEQTLQIDNKVIELKLQQPIQYVLGETEFFGIKLKVNPNVLIPRPETEELVEWIIKSNDYNNPAILDIGTGSGCIAIALAKHLPSARVFALDISTEALSLASENAKLAGVTVNFIEQNILKIPEKMEGSLFDIIVSNPPYVRLKEKELMQPNVLENEPHLALFVDDNDELIFYKAIAAFAQKNLKPNGVIYCEINEALGNQTAEVFRNFGFTNTEVRKDINGRERMVRVKSGLNLM